MKKITILCDTVPPEFSGAGNRIMTQSRHLAAKGMKVEVITQTQGAGSDVEGLTVHCLPSTLRPDSEIKKVLAVPVLFARLLKAIDKDSDVVHCVSGGTSMYTLAGIMAARLKGLKVVVGTTLVGSDDPMTVLNSSFGGIRFGLLASAWRYVSISPQLHDLHLASGLAEEDCYMIPNSVDTVRFHPVTEAEKSTLRDEYGYRYEDKVFITIGAISPRKGTLGMVEAISQRIMEGNDSIRLLCVGPWDTVDADEAYTSSIRTFIEENGLSDRIELLGKRSDVDRLLQMADVFLFNSSHEGFGNVLIEAQACGRTVMTRRIPKITDFIVNHGQDGYVFDSQEGLGDTIDDYLQMTDDDLKQLAEAARKNVLDRFAHEVVIDQYLEAYFG